MASDWPTVEFGSLMQVPTRNGIHKGTAWQGRGVPVIKMGEAYSADIVVDLERDLLDLTPAELEKLSVKADDLLFCRTSLVADGVGHAVLVGNLSRPTTFASNLIRVRLDVTKANPRYWFYYFRSPLGKDHVRTIARGTSVTTITGPDIANLRVKVPKIAEQRAIAHILGTLDDKIELNRRMAATLEEMARAIFKSWFIDFDPVRAKAEGRPTNLPPDIDALFPDSFDDSELGSIPSGWNLGKLGVVCRNLRRPAPTNSISPDEPYVGLDAISKRSLTLMSWGKGGQVESQKSRFKSGEILFGKLRPYFHKVCIAPVDGVCSTDILVIDSNELNWYSYVVLMLSEVSTIDFVTAASDGTRMPRTRWEDLDRMPIVIPPTKLVSRFDGNVRPLLERLQRVSFEYQSLEAIRDTLLPKLISGELRVTA